MSRLLKAFIFKNKRLLSTLLLVVVVFLMIKYISTSWEDLKKIKITSPWHLLALLFFSVANLFANGRGMDAVLTPFGINLSVYETFKISSMTRILNQTAPGRAGIAARANYLKRKYRLPYTQYASSFVASNVIMYCISSISGLVAILFLPQDAKIASLAGILASILFVLILILTVKPGEIKTPHGRRLVRYIRKVVNGWKQIRKERHTLYSTSFWMSINVLTQILTFLASFSVLGVEISFAGAALVSSVTLLSTFIAFTPGALGIVEGFAVVSSVAIGIAAPQAFAATLLRRFSGLAVSGITALITGLPARKS